MDRFYFLSINFAPCAGIVFLFIFLSFNNTQERHIKRVFFWLAVLELVELAAYSVQLWAAARPGFDLLHGFLSAFGYAIRPVLLYLILLLNGRADSRRLSRIALALPLVVNACAAFAVWLAGLSLFEGQSGRSVPTLLVEMPYLALMFYLTYILVEALTRLHGRHWPEGVVMTAIVLFIAASAMMEAVHSIRGIGRTAIVLSTVFYYMFFQTRHYRQNMDEGSRIRRRLEYTSKTDGTTGLLNKTAFLEELEAAVPGQIHSGALMFIDLDHFKELNDTLGHLVGDQAVKDTAEKLRMIFRKADVVGRFGGDEFCAFLPDISPKALYQRLGETVTSLRGEYVGSDACVKVTASIGAVYFAGCAVEGLQLLELADKALYETKKLGRDGYVVKCWPQDAEKN